MSVCEKDGRRISSGWAKKKRLDWSRMYRLEVVPPYTRATQRRRGTRLRCAQGQQCKPPSMF